MPGNEEQFEAEMLRRLYVLDAENQPRHPVSFAEWAAFVRSDRRRVALDKVGAAEISTVFLTDSHGPLLELFETAVFRPHRATWVVGHYATWTEAQAGHQRIKSILRGESDGDTQENQ